MFGCFFFSFFAISCIAFIVYVWMWKCLQMFTLNILNFIWYYFRCLNRNNTNTTNNNYIDDDDNDDNNKKYYMWRCVCCAYMLRVFLCLLIAFVFVFLLFFFSSKSKNNYYILRGNNTRFSFLSFSKHPLNNFHSCLPFLLTFTLWLVFGSDAHNINNKKIKKIKNGRKVFLYSLLSGYGLHTIR